MKQLFTHIALLLISFGLHAEKGHHNDTNSTQGSVEVKFQNNSKAVSDKDSVLVIFDRWNRSAAGAIYQVFYENKDHSITIPAVPHGSYFVTIQCLGLHHDRLETHIRIKARKHTTIKMGRQDTEEFSKDKVIIPAYHPDFKDLAAGKTN